MLPHAHRTSTAPSSWNNACLASRSTLTPPAVNGVSGKPHRPRSVGPMESARWRARSASPTVGDRLRPSGGTPRRTVVALQSRPTRLILGPSRPRLGVCAHLGGRRIITKIRCRGEGVLLDGDRDDARPSLGTRLSQGGGELVGRSHAPRAGAEALGVLGEVDAHELTVEAARGLLTAAELVAEAVPVRIELQAPNALVAVVLGDDDGDLQPFLHGGFQLGGVHQVGAVADEDIDLAVGLCQAHAEAAGIS